MRTCNDVRAKLDELLDGDLLPAEEAAVVDHLAACAACRSDHQRRANLLTAVAGLPREISPRRNLWPGIAVNLKSPPYRAASERLRSSRRSWWLAAAASVMLVTSAVLLGPADRAPVTIAGPERGAVALAEYAPLGETCRGAVAELERARMELRAALEVRRGEIPPAAMAAVDENLAAIDEAIERIRAALDQDPDDPTLNRLLLAVSEREIGLLRRLTDI